MRQSLIRRQPTKRCRKSKKHTTVKEIIKRCRRKISAPLFPIPLNKVKPAKSDSDFAAEGTCLNEQYAFTTSCLYPHNAYLSSTPSAQHNSRIKRTFRPQAFFAILAKCQTPMIFVLRYPLVRRICRNVRTHIT